MKYTGERLVSPVYDNLRVDHITRYMFAANMLAGKRVVDVGCGIGYGSRLLALAGCKVTAVDVDKEAIEYAKEHYPHESVQYQNTPEGEYDAATAFEVIEHIEDPLSLLKNLNIKTLIASVPNEKVVPWTKAKKYHYRHYTKEEFKELLEEAGYNVDIWCTQKNAESGVSYGSDGKNLIVIAHAA